MGFFDFLKPPDMHRGLQAYAQTEGALLLDVRTPEEYRQGHIPGSRNLPLQQLHNITTLAEKKNTALYVYCRSGSRSRQARAQLRRWGYTNVYDLGGIVSYRGSLE